MFSLIRAALVAALSFPLSADAFDSEKWGHDDATREWFKSLHNQYGIPCCDYADGSRIEAPDYKENDDGSYEVFAHGEWMHVSKEHIIAGSNRVGYAIYWGRPGIVFCFMPGARG